MEIHWVTNDIVSLVADVLQVILFIGVGYRLSGFNIKTYVGQRLMHYFSSTPSQDS